MHQQRQHPPGAPADEPSPPEPIPDRPADPLLDRAGPVSHSLEHGFSSVPPIIPLVAIVLVGYVGMVAVLVGIGELIVHFGLFAGLRDWDDSVTRWMADHRTGLLDTITGFVSRAADTLGVIVSALILEI